MFYGEIVGSVPEELRSTLVAPVPPEMQKLRIGNIVGLTWQFDTLDGLSVCPESQFGYKGLVQAILELGMQATGHEPCRIGVIVSQGPARELATDVDSWHTEEILGPDYYGLIASNINGTQLETAGGSIIEASDFEVTLIGYQTSHRAQPDQGDEFRSRITVGYFTK